LPRCQAISPDEVSLITWRDIGTKALKARFAFQHLSFQLRAILCLHKFMLLQKWLPRKVRHFMRETVIVLSLLTSDE
jgi:hypothetical protein